MPCATEGALYDSQVKAGVVADNGRVSEARVSAVRVGDEDGYIL